jgi:hypothetical protein
MRVRALVLAILVSAGTLVGLVALTTASALAASPPVAITNEAVEVKRARATLAGYLLPQGEKTIYYFEYGTEACNAVAETCGVKTPQRGPVTEEGSAEPFRLTRLKPGTTYHLWFVASSAGGTAHGEEMTFTTVTAEPKEYVFEKNLAMGSPLGVTVNQATGNVYATNTTTDTIEQFNSDGILQSSAKMPEGSGETWQLATDNSGIPGQQGNVYVAGVTSGVVYKFDPSPEGKLTLDKVTPEIGKGSLSSPRGVAVDSSGNVYVASSETVSVFSSTGKLEHQNLITGLTVPFGLAVDADGNIYVAGPAGTVEYTSAGACVNACTPINASFDTGVTLDSSGNVFVGVFEPAVVQQYGPSEGHPSIANPVLEQVGIFGQFPRGLAVNDTSHALYVSEEEGSVRVFRFFTSVPVGVKTEPATQVNGPVERLNGTINPGGQEPAEYYFEYGTSPCLAETCGTVATEPSQVPLNGDKAIPVSVRLDNLAPDTAYHYRLVGVNEESGVEYGEEQTFTTGSVPPSPPGAAPEGAAPESKTPASAPIYPLLTGLAPVPPPKVHVPPPPTRAQRLAKALAACGHKPKRKRAACRRQARRKYGAVTKGLAVKRRK